MAREVAEIPEALARLAADGAQAELRDMAHRARALDPPCLMTIARGSSDHAATYLAYAAEIVLGLPVASLRPSIRSVYGRRLRARGTLSLAISQSGSSPDLAATVRAQREGMGQVLALTNSLDSPLANAADEAFDIRAGPERAIAATKSFANSIAAGLWLIARWAEDPALPSALVQLPDALADTPEAGDLADALAKANGAIFVARGPGLGIAGEAALKMQEVLGVPAWAFSAAEILHGPRAMIAPGMVVVALNGGQPGGMVQAREALTAQGVRVLQAPMSPVLGHHSVDPLTDIVPLYRAIEAVALARGRSPDTPPHLSKVTATI